ncbi:MAG: hypothetical protein ABIH66_02185 [bacterium]
MYEWTKVRARKIHACAHCGAAILPGEVYWRNRKNPHAFCEKHSPLSEEVRRARRMKKGQRRCYTPAISLKQQKVSFRPKTLWPPVDEGGALLCPRCHSPLCDTYDPRILICHICGYNYVIDEDPTPDYITLRPPEEETGEDGEIEKQVQASPETGVAGLCFSNRGCARC